MKEQLIRIYYAVGCLSIGYMLLTGCLSYNHTKGETVVLGLTGDVMLGRLVSEAISQNGYAYPWGNMLTQLNDTDLNLINLETTLTTSTQAVPKVFNFRSHPDNVETLKVGNIDVVSLANNHSKDFGNEGLLETLEALDDAHIKHIGAGLDIEAAKEPVIFKRAGLRIGFYGWTDNEPSWRAGEEQPGTNYIEVGNIDEITRDIRKIKKLVDIVVVSAHWGPNMRQIPNQDHIDFAHAIIDAGADIFHGHSAHVIQGVEVYNGKLILYDTGDFVDDYRVTPDLRNDLSFLYLVKVNKYGPVSLELLPARIDSMQVNAAEGEDKAWIFDTMQRLSKQFGTEFKETNKSLELSVS